MNNSFDPKNCRYSTAFTNELETKDLTPKKNSLEDELNEIDAIYVAAQTLEFAEEALSKADYEKTKSLCREAIEDFSDIQRVMQRVASSLNEYIREAKKILEKAEQASKKKGK